MRPFSNLKIKRNLIKFNKFGKRKILISSSIKKGMRIVDGSLLILIRKNSFWKISWPTCRLLPPVNMLVLLVPGSGIGKEV
jgi:hypothetical protein